MGLLQKACETYDAMSHRAGIVYEKEEPLAPVSHIMTRAQIEITLDQDGGLVSARAVGKDEPKIIIPVTEESAGRTSAPCAHPLCDQLGYVSPHNPQKHSLYLDALTDWTCSEHTHPKLKPILDYVRSGTILTDLSKTEIIQLTPEGGPENEKLLVRWVVVGLGEGSNGPCWEDQALMKAFIDYSASRRKDTPPALCMVSGEMDALASQHPKGVVPLNGNAKLISANDTSGFTYRGRFSEDWQAATVSYTSSQKAHNALRWLVANQSVPFGGRTFLCWNPQGIQLPKVTGAMGRRGGGSGQRAANPSQFRQQLKEALSGWKEALPQSAGVVIAAFDAATTGRLAVTYYNELLASDFLQRLHDWEVSCCWENGAYGIQSPSLYQLVSWAFGTPRNGKVEIDDRILAQQMQRLAACRVDKAPFPLDIERALVEKASHLLVYEGENRQKLLFTACAAIRKYHYDLKEEWDMALDKNCTDRSYLFGRLLAIADAIENGTYTDDDRRETNAIRMQKAFTLRPMATWRVLWGDKLRPYAKRLAQSKPGLYRYYQNTADEIMAGFSPADSALNRPLDDIYLLGYSHQRAYRTEKLDKQEIEV